MVSVRGLKAVLPGPVTPWPEPRAWPTEVSGISIEFAQGATVSRLGLQTLQQRSTLATTSILLQIPYELDASPSAPPARLRILESGAVTGDIRINAVTDNVHVLNTCDETLVFLSAAVAAGIPPGVCVPMVFNLSATLLSPNVRANEGDWLTMYAFGLGALDRPFPNRGIQSFDEVPRAVERFTLHLRFDGIAGAEGFESFAPASASGFASGIYQINFQMPRVPAGLAGSCAGTGTNATLLLVGPQSASSMRICAGQPGPATPN